MIDMAIYGALGFLLGCLLALMLTPPLWNRAVRLTTRKLEATMPMSLAEIQADKDQLRAEFAVELRRVEGALEKAKDKAARELITANKRRVEISVLKNEHAAATAQLQEKENATRVLEQTIKRRLPDLDSRLKTAKEVINELETANTELRNTVNAQADVLKVARATVNGQREEIDRLRGSLEGGTLPMRGALKSDARLLKESGRLNVELSRLKEELEQTKAGAEENEVLRHEINKLAGQILAVARGEQQQAQEDFVVETTETLVPYGEEPAERESVHPILNGNGSTQAVDHEPNFNVEEIAAAATGDYEAAAQNDENEEADQPRTSLIRRFASRRAKRSGRQGGGSSLSERLKDVAEAQEG
ncbi:hypothetical protein [Methyloceanibacter sp.]|uniref:hypothetical protein n=1 Tax=Methyloceanibacter sp. TaxID=1965321 RepID=UPI003D9BBCEB